MEWMEAEGYVENTGEARAGRPVYGLTDKARRLSGAYATKPISRQTAARNLALFMTRVAEVNANGELAYKVSSVIVFGSYVGEKEKLAMLTWPSSSSSEPATLTRSIVFMRRA